MVGDKEVGRVESVKGNRFEQGDAQGKIICHGVRRIWSQGDRGLHDFESDLMIPGLKWQLLLIRKCRFYNCLGIKTKIIKKSSIVLPPFAGLV